MSDDVTLVKKAQAGCEDSFRTIVLQVERRLYHVGLSIVGSRHDADDLWQETIIRAWRYLPKLRHPERFRSWIAAILVSESKRVLSKRQTLPVSSDYLPEQIVTQVPDRYLYIHECLEKLPQQQREAVVLRFWADLTLQEMASLLSIPLNTAKTRLYQGIAALESMLGEGAENLGE